MIGPRFLLAAALLAFGLAAAPARAETPRPLSTAEVEAIVRDYLMREPGIVLEAIQELQRREQAAQEERRREAIAALAGELLHDPATPVVGNPEGDVTLVEFFDYRCSFCRRMIPAMQRLLAEDGDLRIALKELPVLGPDSVRAARAALAGRMQDEALYLDLHFALMAADDLSQDGILALAARHGLDTQRLAADMDSPEVSSAIQANYALARALGIEGTPAFVIGEALVPGAVEHGELVALIEEARGS
jgi:protein-disulfide isomerase